MPKLPESEIEKIITNEPHNAWEISPLVKWDTPTAWGELPPLHKRSAVMEVVAHLECMRWEGTVQRIIKDNSVSYVAL